MPKTSEQPLSASQCQICGRVLTASESVAVGCGPVCAAKRAEFVGACGTTDAELASLQAAGGDAAKWVRNFYTDMRAGRVRQARQCIEFARYKAGQMGLASVPAPAPARRGAATRRRARELAKRQNIISASFGTHSGLKLAA